MLRNWVKLSPSFRSAVPVSTGGERSGDWHVHGTRDFDSDILWRHETDTVVTREMENGKFLQTHNFGVVANAWQIRGVGEFDLV